MSPKGHKNNMAQKKPVVDKDASRHSREAREADRKATNALRNAEQHEANLAKVRELGLEAVTANVTRTRTTYAQGRKIETVSTRVKAKSPSKLLRMHKRAAAAAKKA